MLLKELKIFILSKLVHKFKVIPRSLLNLNNPNLKPVRRKMSMNSYVKCKELYRRGLALAGGRFGERQHGICARSDRSKA